eukprot:CAMPEP_0176188538 /NCGR_PEP_ID=MMETSP0121_2-20121125/2966_1 /TAXON_ID=160619 /ORGANISM="Kryptoperidinium foliaceum, Strain CCMP 1326" /LENGTH=548 /DNA_ID=CAMNT_0017527115 /DNA_START=30 /DNA_END=1676 /DNA_ORIENTATION=+
MAFTAHQDERMLEEVREGPEAIGEKAAAFAEMLRAAEHVVVFTGAGISTSAGIPDYRGPEGMWTLQAKGEAHRIRGVDMATMLPTPTHMALAELLRQGLVHHIISQNVDGLHRKSGVPKASLSELHGNGNIEYCSVCRREYLRDFSVHGSSIGRAHETGRRCLAARCGGALHDTIINFGESLPPEEVARAFAHAEKADLVLVMGSSLTVAPASDLPRTTKRRGGKLAIVNLQRTKQDAQADLRAFCGTDDFVRGLMAELATPIPPFRLRRALALWRTPQSVHCAALDPEDLAPATLIRRCVLEVNCTPLGEAQGGPEQVILSVPGSIGCSSSIDARIEFYRHYGEPDAVLQLPQDVQLRHFTISIDPRSDKAWAVDVADSGKVPSPDDILPGKGGAMTARVAPSPPSAPAGGMGSVDTSGWFAVQPVDDCPHTWTDVGACDKLCVDLNRACGTCGNVGENMLCLSCHKVFCGRHVQQHMLAHHEETGHAIVCGFCDLSFWCYKCDEYIVPQNPALAPFYLGMHTAKFGAPPPGCNARLAASAPTGGAA